MRDQRSKVTTAIDEATKEIDRVTEPARMSKREAVDILELLIDAIQSRLDALRDELADS